MQSPFRPAQPLLAIDTGGAQCAVALCQPTRDPVKIVRAMPRGQSEALLPMIAEGLDEAGMQPGDIDRLAVTTGPGSFTGVRVGLAAARGLALALDIPVVGIGSDVALAHVLAVDLTEGDHLGVVIDARRAEVFTSVFTVISGELRRILDPQSLEPAQAAAQLAEHNVMAVCGDGVHLLPDGPTESAAVAVDPVRLAQLAENVDPSDHPAEPVYVRPPDAVVPKAGGRLRP